MCRCMNFSFGRGFRWTLYSSFGVGINVYIIWSLHLPSRLEMILEDGRHYTAILGKRTHSADFGGMFWILPLELLDSANDLPLFAWSVPFGSAYFSPHL